MYLFDAYDFSPHVGIASGRVIIGYVGTAIRYNCSVFGPPVALAARCAGVRQPVSANKPFSGAVTFPAVEWGDRDLNKVIPPKILRHPDGSTSECRSPVKLQPARKVTVKNLPDIEIREITNEGFHLPQLTAEQWAREACIELRRANRLWSIRS
jgi:hypothetical protein